MKISKSKQELARIISENGGWRDGAEFSAIEMNNGDVWFCKEKPQYKVGIGIFSFKDFAGIIEGKFTLPNWHQCILSREEYFNLYPAQDADGWIKWKGGECPVDDCEIVQVKYRDDDGSGLCAMEACEPCWGHYGEDCDIIAYRLHKPEQAGTTEKLSPEAVSAAKDALMSESIEEIVRKPTIEQLAADYRNRKDYADRKQQEADAAKADADAKLEELIAAGKALRLVLSVEPEGSVNTPAHHPLIAGDWRSWRQWKVGDLISWSILGHIGELRIIAVHHDPSRNIGDFEVEDKQGGVYRVYGNECRFIRRP
ncbi:MAG: hypothetical protein ACRDBQ_08095 [Shewanella sp.]